MTQCITRRYVGLDVHKDSIVIAVAELGREAARVIGTVGHEWKALSRVLRKLGPPQGVRVCYEAGPTGYGLARALRAAGWSGDVIAPSLIPRRPGDRIKTDGRAAGKLAQDLRAGELTAVFVP